MKFFVTGGCGFIGSNYVNYLLTSVDQVSKVTVYDKFTYAANLRNLESHLDDSRLNIITGDICDFDELVKAMKEHEIVVHFAAESHVDRSIANSKSFVQTNLFGTYNVLESCRQNRVQSMIQVSTDEVYGSISKGRSDEEHTLRPNSPYAASKAGADMLARSYYVTHNLDVRVTRSCNNYGRYQYPEKVIPVFIKSLLLNEKVPVYGNGKNTREWIHVEDHCRGIQAVLDKGLPGEIYNIGSGIHLTNIELARKISKILMRKTDIIEFVEDRKGHDFRYAVSSKKINRIGFSTQIDFNEGLSKTIDWYKSHESWWN
jgi:dTDP-glucose 4,6-dehydratase